jgi:PmbA protein
VEARRANDRWAELILDEARKRFGLAEVFEEEGEELSVDFEDNRLKEITTQQFRGVGLRVIHRGRIGFASTTDLRDPGRLVEMAEASAAFGDAARCEFPGRPAALPPIETFDERVPKVSAERMVEMGRQALELSRRAAAGYLFSCGISGCAERQRVLNTAGLDVARESTSMSAGVTVQEVRDDGLLEVHEYKSWGGSFESVLDLTGTVLDKMRRASVVVSAGPEAMPMVFAPKALRNITWPIEVALSGQHVHKGSSVLRGRIAQQVLDGRITITDDPTVPFAPGTCAVDGEGTPARRQPLFEDGVLRTYLTDRQTAGLLGTEPSGHGFRNYGSRPSPAHTNLIIAPGNVAYEEMLGGIQRGLIIDQTLGSGQSNVLAGEFSVNVELGFLVEHGRIAGRVKDCMVAGNVYDVLNRVEAIGKEPQWLGSVCAPALMVSGLKLAAKR